MMNRRDFLRWTAIAGAGLVIRPGFAWAYSQSPLLRKFVQPLPGLGPTGIPVATVNRTAFPGADFYDLEAAQFRHQFHPDLAPSKVWGYADRGGPHGYLGGVIVANEGTPVRLRMTNRLPSTHPLPVDTSIPGADGGAVENRIAVHLHGGHVPWNSDGGPFAWFDTALGAGASFANPALDAQGHRIPGAADYYYPNDQASRLEWYHDHAMGITRLNAYAGLASAYVLRDSLELARIRARILPAREIPLIIQDKSFVDGSDENYARGQVGDLWYAYKYEVASAPDGTGRWDYGPDQDPPGAVVGPLPVPSCVPEFFADTPVVNGAAYPFAELEPRHYRLRILNGSQARFYNLQLYLADASGNEVALDAAGNPKASVPFLQIGTEGGFLPTPVLIPSRPLVFDPLTGNPTQYGLLLAPGERADVLVDLRQAPVGSRFLLFNDAPAPFPGGDPRNDYFTGDPDQSSAGGAPTTQPGFGPNTRTLMQLRIVPRVGSADPLTLHSLFSSAGLPRQLPFVKPLDPTKAAVTRNLTLNEDFDEFGRLIQRLGTDVSIGTNTQGLPTFARNYTDAPSETPSAGSIEVWNIFNLTGDTHPIHFHLVNVQVLGRAPFAIDANGKPVLPAVLRAPDANELSWKETVRMNPGEVTTVIMKFDLAKVPFAVPQSPRTGGNEFVWHCHILEHEEHDMMRPLVVR